jgi:uncharacterized coiled-coil protein SlyX
MSAHPNDLSPQSDVEARLTNLELLFTHLERTVAELNSVLLEHGGRLDRLTAALGRLRDELPPGPASTDETDQEPLA